MSLAIYTYSNPYEINNEPFWDSVKNCAHFCVSQTMVNGLSAVYDELNDGQLATVEELVEALYPNWFDTKNYIEQYTILTNTLDNVTPNIEPERWKKIKQSLRFNKSSLLDSIRLMAEMGLWLKNLNIKKITEEQKYLVAAYNAILHGENASKFYLKRNFSEKEIDQAVKTALVAKNLRRGKEVKSIEKVNCDTVVIHGIHQFTPTILSMIEEVSKYKRVVLMFNYQQQYNEIYQTWLDVYSCFDLNIKSQFNNEFKPSTLLQASYKGNILADQIGKLVNGSLTERSRELNDIRVIEFDNITEFSAYVAQIFEEATIKYHADEQKKGSALSYMREQFYSANNSVNDILKVYFPEQFGERHFLAYPIGHFFVAVTNMWDSENGGIKIENMNDIAECLYSGALFEKNVGSLITTFNLTKNYFSRARSIRKFKPDMIPQDILDRIIEAGTFAANGRGAQNTIIIQVTNKEIRDEIAKRNADIMGSNTDPFYGAPVILIVLGKKEWPTHVYDGSLVMGNLMLAAHDLGIGSCWIHRAKEEFESDWGKELLKSLGIEDEYEGIGHCALGYVDGDYPDVIPRKENRVFYI